MTFNRENEIRTYGEMIKRLDPICDAMTELLQDIRSTGHWDPLVVEKLYRTELAVKQAKDLSKCFDLDQDQPDYFKSDEFKEWIKQRRMRQYEDELAYEAESERENDQPGFFD